MKKLFLIVCVLFSTSFMFAEVFDGGQELVESFFKKGTYVKIIKDSNNISYIPNSCISSIEIDEDEIEIATTGYTIWTGKNNSSFDISIKKYNVFLDEDCNIIIVKK